MNKNKRKVVIDIGDATDISCESCSHHGLNTCPFASIEEFQNTDDLDDFILRKVRLKECVNSDVSDFRHIRELPQDNLRTQVRDKDGFGGGSLVDGIDRMGNWILSAMDELNTKNDGTVSLDILANLSIGIPAGKKIVIVTHDDPFSASMRDGKCVLTRRMDNVIIVDETFDCANREV